MNGHCKKCGLFGLLAPANKSRLTGERLYRKHCISCEKDRKDEWRALNINHHNKKCRDWAKRNPDKAKKSKQVWRRKNPEKMFAATKEWRKNNLEKSRAYVNARRRKLRIATPQCLDEFDLFLMSEIYHLAQITSMTVDHIVPLNHKDVCGLHVPWNLQILEASSNYKKSNSFNGVATR